MTDRTLASWTATELRAGYATSALTPVDVLESVLAVIAEREPTLNALWQRTGTDLVRAQAAASRDRWRQQTPLGPLDGIPMTLKENLARAGVPMPSGTAGVVPVVPDRDSPVAARVAESGAIVCGSSVMPDWGMLSSGVSSLHGVTRSPWDPNLTTGGSSSGAGAAAAAGYGPVHVGTDIGGSIRLPGTWLGLATLKPSAGRVPLDAPYLGRAAGPIARSAADCALALSVLARPDNRDWTALPEPDPGWFADLVALAEQPDDVASVRGLRVGVHLSAGAGLPLATGVAAAIESVAAAAEAAGAQVQVLDPWLQPRWLEDLDRFWRVRSLVDLEALPAERAGRVLPFIQRWVRAAAGTSGEQVLKAYASIMQMQQATAAATEPFDLVISPVSPVLAFPAEFPMPWGDTDLGMAHIGFTAPYNMSGQPAGTVNAGNTPDGRTVGVQFAGRRFDDLGVLRAMRWWESVRPSAASPVWPI